MSELLGQRLSLGVPLCSLRRVACCPSPHALHLQPRGPLRMMSTLSTRSILWRSTRTLKCPGMPVVRRGFGLEGFGAWWAGVVLAELT